MRKFFGKKLGEAEIEDFGLAAFGDEYIGRLDVAMNDASSVCNIKGVGNLNSEIEDVLDGERLALDMLTESFTVDEFHDDERTMILFPNVVDGAYAGMIESGSGVGFAAETLQSVGILIQVIG